MIRVAAVGDIHMSPESAGSFRPAFDTLGESADLLLLAGDLTRHGTLEEARVVAREVAGLDVPVVAVLGNHDYQSDQQAEVTAALDEVGVTVLEGEGTVLDISGVRVGVAGAKGFCGGFAGRSGGEFGEPEMKAFIQYTRRSANGLAASLQMLRQARCSVRIALTHYSPVPDTLAGEPLEIYPFLGSYLLAEAVDEAGADLAVHGLTSGGVRVRNVAQPVIGRAFAVYHLPVHAPGIVSGDGGTAAEAGRRAAERAVSQRSVGAP